MLATAATVAATARLLTPLISDLYAGAKRAGVRGLLRWDAMTFSKKLARRIRAIEEVKTLWKPDQEVSLLDFYHPPKVLRNGLPGAINRLTEFGPGNFVVEGIVGQGKSIFLRNIALQEILSNDATRLPVFIELRTLSSKLSLEQAILKQLSSYDIDVDNDSLEYLKRSGRISYLLDGFDELEEVLTKETLHEIEFLSQKFPELQIIVTSRPGNEIQKSTAFTVLKIAPLQSTDYSPFLAKLGIPGVQISLIKEAIRTSPSRVAQLITTPLMLILVVIVYQSEKEIPETLPEFFERLFQIVFTRHDKMKAAFHRKHYSGLSERRLQALFEAFCFMTMQNGFTRSLTPEQFSKSFDDALEYSENCQCEAGNFKLDITKVACLMQEEGLDITTFLHKSIMEYYAAAFIKHSTDEVAALFYQSVQGSSRNWWEVLSFLKDIDPFRYSRDFVVPEIEFIRVNLLAPLSMRDDRELIDFFAKTHPGLSVFMRRNANGKEAAQLTIAGMGHFQRTQYVALEGLDNLVMRAMEETLPESLNGNDMMATFGMSAKCKDTDIGEFRITIPMQIKEYGSEHFWRATDQLSNGLDHQLTDAQAVIEGQERRKRIFAKKAGQQVRPASNEGAM